LPRRTRASSVEYHSGTLKGRFMDLFQNCQESPKSFDSTASLPDSIINHQECVEFAILIHKGMSSQAIAFLANLRKEALLRVVFLCGFTSIFAPKAEVLKYISSQVLRACQYRRLPIEDRG